MVCVYMSIYAYVYVCAQYTYNVGVYVGGDPRLASDVFNHFMSFLETVSQ